MVVVANYVTGNVASFPVEANGSLGPAKSVIQHEGKSVDPKRQTDRTPTRFVVSPDNKYAFAADLGLDRIFGYALDPAKATLDADASGIRPDAAARRPAASDVPSRRCRMLYAINEIENSVTMFDYHAETGTLIEQQTISTLPADFQGDSNTADLKITPDGRFLYGTNRGHDSIASYEIGKDGRLKLIGDRTEPRQRSAEPGDHRRRRMLALRQHAGEQRRRLSDRRQDRQAESRRRSDRDSQPVVHHDSVNATRRHFKPKTRYVAINRPIKPRHKPTIIPSDHGLKRSASPRSRRWTVR